jgi:hypothetical protein
MNNSAFFKSVQFTQDGYNYSAVVHHNLNLQDPCALIVQVYETQYDRGAKIAQAMIQPLDGNSVKITLDRVFRVGAVPPQYRVVAIRPLTGEVASEVISNQKFKLRVQPSKTTPDGLVVSMDVVTEFDASLPHDFILRYLRYQEQGLIMIKHKSVIAKPMEVRDA